MFAQAWAFIIAREVEAPQRFQAIQSHRAAQAILHQQTQYVSHLLDTAVVDDHDGRDLLRSNPLLLTGPTAPTGAMIACGCINSCRHDGQRSDLSWEAPSAMQAALLFVRPCLPARPPGMYCIACMTSCVPQ